MSLLTNQIVVQVIQQRHIETAMQAKEELIRRCFGEDLPPAESWSWVINRIHPGHYVLIPSNYPVAEDFDDLITQNKFPSVIVGLDGVVIYNVPTKHEILALHSGHEQ